MALLRAYRAGAVCVLGSATPSVTSVELARSGKLRLLELPARARATSVLPIAEIVDSGASGPDRAERGYSAFRSFGALETNAAGKEQAILFLKTVAVFLPA